MAVVTHIVFAFVYVCSCICICMNIFSSLNLRGHFGQNIWCHGRQIWTDPEVWSGSYFNLSQRQTYTLLCNTWEFDKKNGQIVFLGVRLPICLGTSSKQFSFCSNCSWRSCVIESFLHKKTVNNILPRAQKIFVINVLARFFQSDSSSSYCQFHMKKTTTEPKKLLDASIWFQTASQQNTTNAKSNIQLFHIYKV